MFKTNYTLIENISNEFNIDKNEINLIIKELFDKISLSIINGNKFYMDKLGVISTDEDKNIFFSNEDESFDESLESIDVKSKELKNIFLEKSIYKSIFKNIKDISKNEHVYIENFGTFYYNSNIIFEPDTYLENKVKNTKNNEIAEYILDELDNKILNKRIENINNDETLEEVIDEENNSIDDNIIENIWKNKTYNSIDLNTMIKNLNENEEKTEDNENTVIMEEEKNQEEKIDYPEMKEYSKEELLDINNFDEDYLNKDDSIENDNKENKIENNKKEEKEEKTNYPEMKEYSKEELLDINNFDKDYLLENDKDMKDNENVIEVMEIKEKSKKEENNYPEMKEYSKEELLDINNFDKNDLNDLNEKNIIKNTISNKNIEKELLNIKNTKELDNKKMKKRKENFELLKSILKVAFIIIFILIVGVFISIYYGSNRTVASNNVENQKLYDVVNTFFNSMNAASLSYITSKDMYYWDIAKYLYGDATYWPLLYSYNNDKYKINNVIKKGSSISYRNIPDFYSYKEIKNLDNTLSKSYMLLYPILINDRKLKHALWALKLSAYYDLNVFKNNADMIPENTYNNIVKESSSIKITYDEFIRYGQLNENILLSFIDIIKEKLGISK
ncbi:hypothetical protein [Brachyspira murdochii]|uniref:Uncharacterized protein n=1 Tax=Brachyspira murdochii (strain ATCC 51284 / DSM 12563 / 56-150) TaxID=526224 RepID=D5U705_BRAM5|nr:hypothetical protein [Brachyspira murdochii]ADG72729.1 hypothetical protein Bmur_2661 [Brachyspira murdochii DSM 12563]